MKTVFATKDTKDTKKGRKDLGGEALCFSRRSQIEADVRRKSGAVGHADLKTNAVGFV